MTAPRAARAVLRLAVLMAGAGLAAPAPESGYGLPRDVSVDGFRIDELIHFTLAAITVIFVVVAAALIWSFVNHRRDRPAFYSHGSGRSIGVVVGGVAAILVGVDGYLFVHTLGDMHGYFWNFPRAEAAEGAVRIEVNAHQWSWHARYAGVDGKFGTPDDIVSVDDLKVPVGVPVIVQLASTDVIHSMYLPNFRVKQDAVPGRTIAIWFTPDKEGTYQIACAQLCGTGHYTMRGNVTVESQAAFDQWLQQQAAH